MSGRIIGAIGGAGCLLLGGGLGIAALPSVSAGQEYSLALGWLDLRLDGLSLYCTLLGLVTLGLALLAGRWAGGWQLLPLAATYLIVLSYTLGEWSLGLRLAAELGATAVMLVGLTLVWRLGSPPRLLRWGGGYLATMLTAWGMVALAICSAEPSAVAGGLLMAAPTAGLGVAISTPPPSLPRRGRDYPDNWQLATGNWQPLVALWLYLHAALGRGELFYAALMLVGATGVVLGLLRLRPEMGWLGWVYATLDVALFAGGAVVIDTLLRPALAGLAGLPAWTALRVQRLDLPAPQPDAAVGIALQSGADSSLLPLLAIALAFGFALVLAWLLYRLLMLFAGIRHEV